MEKTVCKNCGNQYQGNYCNNCGQNANVKRFSFFYFIKETFASSLDIETGFFNTIKILLIRPGHAIREYIHGKRLTLYVPGKFLIIFGAIATFVVMRYSTITTTTNIDLSLIDPAMRIDFMGFFSYAEHYTTLVNIFAIPVFALFTWLFFKKGYNYAENLVLNTYITSMQLIIFLIFTPFIELYRSHQEFIISVYSVLIIVYNIWVVLTFFNEYRVLSFFKMALALFFSFVGQLILNYCIYILIARHLLT